MTTTAPSSAADVTLPERLDPFQLEHLDDPYPLYAELRRRGPVGYLPGRNLWLVSHYASVSATTASTSP
jgi:cytochrome P450